MLSQHIELITFLASSHFLLVLYGAQFDAKKSDIEPENTCFWGDIH